jgi:cellulose synthase/poly-beta-1,6-N-acetylglucosamine synthase-like glycosyltransferase/peptidoglycan/xylan/chitin deacetylase (PgdA/CDA1 family)
MAKPTDPVQSFIFHDPSGKRWVRIRRTLQTASIFLGALAVAFVLSLIIIPNLPLLGLPPAAPFQNRGELRSILKGEKPEKNVPFRMVQAGKNLRYVRSANPVMHPKAAATPAAGGPLVFGFFVNWDRASIVSLRLNLAHLTHLLPEWLVLKNAKGDIDDQSDSTVITIARDAKLPILAMVTNYRDGWQGGDVHHILHDKKLSQDLIDNIYSNLQEHKFAGVNIDFEQLNRTDRKALVTFMTALHARLAPQGMIVTESVPIGDDGYDLKSLAEQIDYLVPMVYDEHYQSGSPGPVASEQWFEGELDKLAKIVPPAKTVVGFGAYGYDWIIGQSGGTERGFNEIMAAGVQNQKNAHMSWDDDQENPVLRYEAFGDQHEIWFLDAVTALNQVKATEDLGFRGVGVWRLGAEDPDLWRVLKRESWPEENYDPNQLAVLTAEKQVNPYAGGEFLDVVNTPQQGRRTVKPSPTPDGDYSERYEALPTYYVVKDSGRTDEKIICLSFDDGPDAHYTPRILDILSAKHVPATFFVIGVNAEKNIDIIKREFREGHEIGNHTYSHPNIAEVSDYRAYLELTWTQRILENATGRSTTLFRPPYNADSEPQTPEELRPILIADKYHYVTVGESIDPRDWQPGSTGDSILDEVKSESDKGHIILLHDAGGNREPTIAALPKIIDYFQANGYRFARAGELIHKNRDAVMPVPSAEEMRWARLEGRAFDLKSNFFGVLGWLFLAAIYLTAARSFLFGTLAVVQKLREDKMPLSDTYRPPVSVLIAAFNEETVIRRTVESILNNGYDDLEIVIVDDGSKDSTYRVLQDAFGENSCVCIFTQPNSGKSAALNLGITHAKHNVLIAVDADTLFARGTIAKLARHFADERVGAVSGNAKVGNKQSWLTRFQSIEYIYGFNLDRRALDLLNAITVVPGAVGAWRKDIILKLGGFGHDTLAEDADLTLKIRRDGYIIRYEQDAIAYTEAPETASGLAKQRFRWAFGTLQAAWKHRDALFIPKYGTLGFIALPSIWLFQVMLSSLSPFAEIAMIIALFIGNWKIVLLYYLAFFVLELFTGVLAYTLEGEKPWDLSLLFFQRIYYRQMMHYVLGKSLLYAARGRLVGWGKLERRATVTHMT